jgi:hypothetical protein
MANPPSVDVKRRRKGEGPKERAEAPVRRESGESGGPVRPSGTGGMGGFRMPSKGKMGGGCGGFLVVIVIILYIIFSGGNGLGTDTGTIEQQPLVENNAPVQNIATSTPRPTRVPSSGDSGQKWLVMLYQDADDQVLEQDISIDLNEAERIGSSDRVTIVAQLDRYRGGYSADGNWTSTRRYLVTQDQDLTSLHSQLVEDLGESNMADGQTLVDFVTWAVGTYEADRYVLIMSDHGMGWPGGWSDPSPGATDPGKAPLISVLDGDNMYLSEIDNALAKIQQNTGLEKLDIIGLDACLMSQLEIYAALQPYAHYAVASEETEPGLGWAYAGFLKQLVNNPDMSSEQLAVEIVDSYIEQDERIVDDQARADFLRQGSQRGGFFGVSQVSAAQLASQLTRNITLTAVDLDSLQDLMTSFNNFAYDLQETDQRAIASARNYAQSYTSIFGKEVPPSYIDLGHFVQLVARQTNDNTITQRAGAVIDALNRTIVAEKHGQSKPGSTGIAIYFPNSSLYRSPYTGLQSYTMLADRFARGSLWDDFLAFHYNDRTFRSDALEPVTPPSGGITRAPGAGNITISGIEASGVSVAPGDAINLSAEVSGQNVGYVYLFTGLYDSQSNAIFVADTDYLESPDTRQLSGVYYPAWPDNETFRLNFDWEPIVFTISDGNNSPIALFNPGAYGASAEDAVYIVNGTYTFANTGEQRNAQLLFKDGKLFQVFGYYGQQETGAPAEISPEAGDTFTLSQKWMDLDSSGNVTQTVYDSGQTLTFGYSLFTWEQMYAPAGEYLVGFLVSDLDGNVTESYTQITVR